MSDINSTVIIPIVQSAPSPPPKCPHCKEDLPGWSEPSEIPWFAVPLVILFLFGLWTFLDGIYNGYEHSRGCRDWPNKKIDFLMPTYGLGCSLGHWGGQDL